MDLHSALSGLPFYNIAKAGSPPNNTGKCRSEAARIAISKGSKGKQITQEHRDNLSKALKGRSFTEEHKRKISRALLGNTNFKGKKICRISKKKIESA